MGGGRTAAIGLAAIAIAAVAWLFWPEGDEGAIRRRLHALAEEANTPTDNGLGTIAKAARMGDYFTEQVLVEPGAGSEPISGRDTVIGMATRLRQATGPAIVDLKDLTVEKRAGSNIVDVTLTVTFTRRDSRTSEQTMDAREFGLEVQKEGGEWRIARVVAVDTLR